jgi:hypothetical protein
MSQLTFDMISNYDVGAFEALEWAWNLLRTQKGIGSLDEAVNSIQEMLYTIGNGNQVNFRQKIKDMRFSF